MDYMTTTRREISENVTASHCQWDGVSPPAKSFGMMRPSKTGHCQSDGVWFFILTKIKHFSNTAKTRAGYTGLVKYERSFST